MSSEVNIKCFVLGDFSIKIYHENIWVSNDLSKQKSNLFKRHGEQIPIRINSL